MLGLSQKVSLVVSSLGPFKRSRKGYGPSKKGTPIAICAIYDKLSWELGLFGRMSSPSSLHRDYDTSGLGTTSWPDLWVRLCLSRDMPWWSHCGWFCLSSIRMCFWLSFVPYLQYFGNRLGDPNRYPGKCFCCACSFLVLLQGRAYLLVVGCIACVCVHVCSGCMFAFPQDVPLPVVSGRRLFFPRPFFDLCSFEKGHAWGCLFGSRRYRWLCRRLQSIC